MSLSVLRLGALRAVVLRLFRNERGQATVEYILLLAVVIGLGLMVIQTFLKPFLKRLAEAVGKRFDGLFRGDFHRFPVRRR